MNCRQMLTHIVREGDSFYSLAQSYQIPMEMLMAQNPNLNPYNLQVGMEVVICMDQMQNQWNGVSWEEVIDVSNDMREAWIQHVYWIRMLLISIAERLKDQQAVTNRLMKNPNDIAEVFAKFYPPEITNMISRLLTEHLNIGAALITALRDNKTGEAAQLSRQWYANAEQMAEAFSRINPYYRIDELRNMLYRHLDLTIQEITTRLSGDYALDIEAFDDVENEVLEMSDYFTSGLTQQFSERF